MLIQTGVHFIPKPSIQSECEECDIILHYVKKVTTYERDETMFQMWNGMYNEYSLI